MTAFGGSRAQVRVAIASMPRFAVMWTAHARPGVTKDSVEQIATLVGKQLSRINS